MLIFEVGFIISTVLGAVTIVVYGIIAATIFRHWKIFNSSYYKLYLVSSALNVASYLNSWPILRLPNIVCKDCPLSSLYDQGDFTGFTTMRFLYIYLFCALICIEQNMAFNRYTAVAYHQSYDKIWSKLLLPSIILPFIIASLIAYPSYINPSYFVYLEASDHYLPRPTEDSTRRDYTIMIGESIAAALLLLQGAMTIRALWRTPLLPNRITEGKLFIHSFLNSISLLNIAVYACCYHFFVNEWLENYGNIILAYLLDLITFTSPFGLILCSSELRRRIFSRKTKPGLQSSIVAKLIILIGFIISTILGAVTLVVYFLIARTIIRHWKIFNSSYYKLYLFSSLLNVVSYLNSFLILRLPNIICKGCPLSSFYDQGDFWGLTTMRFLYVYLLAAMIFIEQCMAFNRYTAVAFHLSYNKIWSFLFPLAIIGSQLTALIIAYPSYFYPSYFVYLEGPDIYISVANEDANRRELTVMIGECFAAALLFLQGAMTIRALWRTPLLPNRIIEGKLFIHSFLNSFCTLNIAIYACCFHFIKGDFFYNYGNIILAYLLDLITFTSPFGLILCSSELRSLIFSRKTKRGLQSSIIAVIN